MNFLRRYQSEHYLTGDVYPSKLNFFRINRKYYICEKHSSKYCAIVRYNLITKTISHYFIEMHS